MRLILVVLVCCGALSAWAQEQERRQLRAVQEELAARADKQRQLAEQAQAAGREAEALARKLAATAADVQAAEARVTGLEDDITMLSAVEQQKIEQLAQNREGLARILAALQQLSRQPPQASLLAPGDAVDVVRAGKVLSSLSPLMREQVEETRKNVADLRTVRLDLNRKRGALTTSLADLAAEQERLDKAVTERRRQRELLARQADTEQSRMTALSARAEDLTGLIEKLEEEAKAAAAAQALAATQEEQQNRRMLSGLSVPAANLPLPARGQILKLFGDSDARGGRAKGMTIATRNQAQVVVPFEGRVRFSAPFAHYGLLLIIDHGDGYHSVLSGMREIYVDTGQWVLAGEPVGRMAVDGVLTAREASSRTMPQLYFELRRAGQPVDPLPWLSAGKGKVG